MKKAIYGKCQPFHPTWDSFQAGALEVENARKTTLSIPFTSLSFHSLRMQSFETSIFVASFLEEWSDPANIDSVFQSSGVFLVALAVNAFQRLG